MFKAPIVVGVRQYRDWNEAGSVKSALDGLGQNTGNLLFTQGIMRSLVGCSWGSFGLSEGDTDGRDAIVIAAANWINSFEDFGWLADRLEKTHVPVILVGIGAQSSLQKEIPNIPKGTLRLLSLVQDRSALISTRGTFTSDVLNHYGFKHTVATGCPSLLLAGPQGLCIDPERVTEPQAACLHATRHGARSTTALDYMIYSYAFRNELDIVLQSETPDIIVALSRELEQSEPATVDLGLEESYDSAQSEGIRAFLKRHGRVFCHIDAWLHYMNTRSFCLGTRIHGTIASLLAGTPATLIVHDSRTLEMAEAMSIPHVLGSDFAFPPSGNLTSIYDRIQTDLLQRNYYHYRARFSNFFQRNGLGIGG